MNSYVQCADHFSLNLIDTVSIQNAGQTISHVSLKPKYFSPKDQLPAF